MCDPTVEELQAEIARLKLNVDRLKLKEDRLDKLARTE